MSSTSPQMTGVDMVNPFFLCPKKERERKRNWYFGLKRPGWASEGAGAGADLDTLLGAWAVLTGGPGWGGRYACGRVTGNTGSPSMERTPRSALRRSLCMAADLSLPPPGPYLQDRAARSQPPAGRRCALSTACHVPFGAVVLSLSRGPSLGDRSHMHSQGTCTWCRPLGGRGRRPVAVDVTRPLRCGHP